MNAGRRQVQAAVTRLPAEARVAGIEHGSTGLVDEPASGSLLLPQKSDACYSRFTASPPASQPADGMQPIVLRGRDRLC